MCLLLLYSIPSKSRPTRFSFMDKSVHRLSWYFVVKHIFQLTTRWAGKKKQRQKGKRRTKKAVICVYVLPGSRKASRKSHHEFNEKRQISRVQCWPGLDPHFCPVGRLAGRLPDPASASAETIIVCKKFMHVAIAYIKKWCSKSGGALLLPLSHSGAQKSPFA